MGDTEKADAYDDIGDEHARIVFTNDDPETSAAFNDREILIYRGQAVKVARSSKEEKEDINNVFFNCRVLSKNQAEIKFTNGGDFVLSDSGSSNGTFINNFRLSKPGKISKATKIYTGDTVRFGSNVTDKNKQVKEKGVIGKIKIILSDGTIYETRPSNDRLNRQIVEEPHPSKDKDDSFTQKLRDLKKDATDGNESDNALGKVDFLARKLKRKENELENLFENVNCIKERELSLAAQVGELTAKLELKCWELDELSERFESKTKESQKLSDQLAVNVKDQMDNVKAQDLQIELEETRQLLKRTTEEVWLVKERLRIEQEAGKRRDKDGMKKKDNIVEGGKFHEVTNKLKDCQEEIENQKHEIKQLNDLVSEADNIVKEKEKDIQWLNDIVDKDERLIKERDGDYLNLKCLMTEENETVHQIENEMQRLLQIVQDDQETILNKDKLIIGLQKALKEKEALLAKDQESSDIRDEVTRVMEKQEKEFNTIKTDLESKFSESESKIFALKIELEAQKMLVKEKDIDIEELNKNIISNQLLESKLEDKDKEVELKNENIENLQNKLKSQQTKLESIIEGLQKDTIALKMENQQKDLDLKTLKDNIDYKEEIISKNGASIEQYKTEIKQIKEMNIKSSKEERKIEENEELISNLQLKVIKEQELNKQTEEEVIQLRIEIDNLRVENEKMRLVETPERLQDLSQVEQVKLFKLRDEEIEHLKMEIEREQQIVAHVQLTQEKEIIQKEREISVLQSVLAQERQILMEKERELSHVKQDYCKENGTVSTPRRPKRIKLANSTDLQKDIIDTHPGDASEDESETVTFHDALSDEEDILIEDLELDIEDTSQHRLSDIINLEEDLSLG